MSRRVVCPVCGLKGELPPKYKAKHVRCVRCQARFPVDSEAVEAEQKPSTSLGFRNEHDPRAPSIEDFEAMVPEGEAGRGADQTPSPTPPTWLADDDFGPGEEYPSGGAHPIASISTASRLVAGLTAPVEPSRARPEPVRAPEPWLYEIASWHAKLAGIVGVVQFPLIAGFVLLSRSSYPEPTLEAWQAWVAISLSIMVLFLIPLLAGLVLVLVDAARLLRAGTRVTRWTTNPP